MLDIKLFKKENFILHMSGQKEIEVSTVYFDKQERGRFETDKTLQLAKKRADELGIKNIVIASSTGETGRKASEVFKGYNLVVVTSVAEHLSSDPRARFNKENRKLIRKNGGNIITAAHAFGTLGRSVNRKFGAIQVDEVIAHVLRLFSAGVKVGCEVACMAVDAGLVGVNEETIALGGQGGADTAIVVKPSNTHNFFDTRILEIVCKPRG
jgi:hypothetical protein